MNEMNSGNDQDKPCGKIEAVSSTCQRIVEIRLGGVVHPSAVHPFYVPGKGWVNSADLLGATNKDAALSSPNSSEQPVSEQARPAAPIIGFVAGTPILTPNGSVPIEQLKPGDLILTKPDDCEDNSEPEVHEDDRTSEEARWWELN